MEGKKPWEPNVKSISEWKEVDKNSPLYDHVNSPTHYNKHPSGVECITITQEFNFNIGNAIKYLWRAGLKPGNEAIQDLAKAAKYTEFEIRRIKSTSAS